ncbi:hypothetical protein GCM10009843_00350 [Nocardioides bigeumensis]|uniref:PKD domain-containing protein n=1 Tax=Nocardioides bigeumensis TaxID=433657 RepID=A0ABN2XJY1_9ACTN
MRRAAAGLLFVTALVLLPASAAFADCTSDASLLAGQTRCFNSGAELTEYVSSAEGAAYSYRLSQLCSDLGDSGVCDNPRACVSGKDPGTLYSVLRRPVTSPNADWEAFAVVCLIAGEEPRFEVITWQRVFEVMKTLEWPEADLAIQPVGGKTLVNFETNFFTTTTEPSTQTVRLLGREVQIEATPVSYTWHWGDGSDAYETDNPGAEHVDGVKHQVFHVYTDADVTERPSVDVTYRGRYKVEDEPWRPIHETLTVTGTPVRLEVVTARVHLVGGVSHSSPPASRR